MVAASPFGPDIGDPRGWSAPVKSPDGEQGVRTDPNKPDTRWHVTAMGTGRGETGNVIGRKAPLFINGKSRGEAESLRNSRKESGR